MNRTKTLTFNFAKELAALERMGPADLRKKYQQVFGGCPHTGNKPYLIKRIAWRLQAIAEGGLSQRAIQRAIELADDADLRTTAPRSHPVAARIDQVTTTHKSPIKPDRLALAPGTHLTRVYRDRMIRVTVLDSGFEFEGETYRSLSAVARKATGTRWNGLVFFGLKGKE